jgi:replicative DNA helicase
MNERLPPQAPEAERSLLGTLLRNPATVEEIRDQVAVDDFYFDCNQAVYAAIARLADRGKPFDVVGVKDELQAAGDLDRVGWNLLAELTAEGGFNHDIHVERVVAASLRRGLIHASTDAINDAYDGTGPAEELLEQAQGRLDRLGARGVGPEAATAVEVVNETLNNIDARSRGERSPGLPTSFDRLDEMLVGGLPIGGLTVVAARPSVGKTSIALALLRNVCERGNAVFIASLEQRRSELTERLFAGVANVNGSCIRSGSLTEEQAKAVGVAADVIRSWKMRIDDNPSRTAGQIASAARRSRRSMKALDLVIVDYLGLVTPDDTKQNRNEQVGASCRRLRKLARDLDVPLLLLCQLNRSAEDEPPRLSHLRDSGEIEAHSDTICFLNRATARQPSGPGRVDLSVAKQRNGPIGVVEFEHQSETFTWREVSAIE